MSKLKKPTHQHLATSNTDGCFNTFVGCTVSGFIEYHGARVLIFTCGCGLTLSHNGSFWIESKEDVDRMIGCRIKDLQQCSTELRTILSLAGR
jgi:hypothetical protein